MCKQIKEQNKLPPLEGQVNFWNKWNHESREEISLDSASERRADFVLEMAWQYSSGGPISNISDIGFSAGNFMDLDFPGSHCFKAPRKRTNCKPYSIILDL